MKLGINDHDNLLLKMYGSLLAFAIVCHHRVYSFPLGLTEETSVYNWVQTLNPNMHTFLREVFPHLLAHNKTRRFCVSYFPPLGVYPLKGFNGFDVARVPCIKWNTASTKYKSGRCILTVKCCIHSYFCSMVMTPRRNGSPAADLLIAFSSIVVLFCIRQRHWDST